MNKSKGVFSKLHEQAMAIMSLPLYITAFKAEKLKKPIFLFIMAT